MSPRALALITALAACVDVSASQRASLLGACTFNDECQSPLLCAAGRCRAQCRTDRDCVNDWRCLSAGVANQSVCYAPDDFANACVWSSQCRGGRICGGDRVCRKQCLTDYDCRVIDPSLWCVAPGLCSSHPFLDGGVPADVDLNLLSGAARADATTPGDVPAPSDTSASSDTGGDAGSPDASADAGPTGPAEMPTVVSGTGCGPSTDTRSCTPGTPGCDVLDVQGSLVGNTRCIRLSDGSVRCWGNGYANTFGVGGISMCFTSFVHQRLHGASALELGGGSGCAMFTPWRLVLGQQLQQQRRRGHRTDPAAHGPPRGHRRPGHAHRGARQHHLPRAPRRHPPLLGGRTRSGSSDRATSCRAWAPSRSPLTDVIAVAPGETHVCALRRDRTVWCWGANCAGESGQPPPRPPSFPYPTPTCRVSLMTPTQVPGIADVQELAAGRYFTCARHSNGTVQCWGWNDGGALGRGSVGAPGDYSPTPAPVVDINDALSLSTPQGARRVCAPRRPHGVVLGR
jgi:hypothetical protein